MKTVRVELTFSSGKFIAWEEVKKVRFSEDDSRMILTIVNENYKLNEVVVMMNKLDFYEIFDNN